METVDTVVIGAGVIGLAVARRLALAGREVLILEEQPTFGTQTSSRNSEVIHAGLYYPTGSLKAELCVRGKEALYRYCAERGVAHRRIGKLLIACDEAELSTLATYAGRAAANGVSLEPLDAAAIHRLEPAVRAVAGLYSASTGIIDRKNVEVLQSDRPVIKADAQGKRVAIDAEQRAAELQKAMKDQDYFCEP